MQKDKTLIVLIIDRSGSMSRLIDSTLEGANALKNEQANLPGKCEFELIVFNNEVMQLIPPTDINEVPDISTSQVYPNGGTALYDAVGMTIERVGKRLAAMPEDQRPEHVLIGIQTDGEENMSRKFHGEQIQNMVKHQTDIYNWKFQFLGAGIDAIAGAKSIGISAANAFAYAATIESTRNMLGSLSREYTAFRSVDISDALAQPTPTN